MSAPWPTGEWIEVALAYGRGRLPVRFPAGRTTVIEPAHVPGLPDERGAVRQALARPIGTRPLRDWLKPGTRVCILFTDLTRATPNDRLIPWLLEALAGVPRENITLLSQTGTHRGNTAEEFDRMLTPAVARSYRVLNHDCEDAAAMAQVGVTGDGSPALLNRLFLEADVKIVTGFIEPHFFAGFSGGPKGIMPGVAGLQTVMSNHGPRNLGHPNATFGITEGNPLWEELRDIALRAGPAFLLNVALNRERQITGVFAGELLQAHAAGCRFVKGSAMARCTRPFDVVVTTNSGYPLDLNLYQGVKGMSAGARIIKPGGTLILACECSEGLPAGSSYERILHDASSAEGVLEMLARPGPARPEQWQAQIQALVRRKAKVLLHSALPDAVVRSAHLEPCPDIAGCVRASVAAAGPGATVAVIPEGPLTIPYLD